MIRHINKVNRIESPERDPFIYIQLNFERRARVINGERTLLNFSPNGAGPSGKPPAKK